MKPFVLLIFGVTALAGQPPEMVARFQNGNEIAGRIAGLGEDFIRWESDNFIMPQSLSLKKLSEIRDDHAEELEPPPGDHLAIATLTNGDTIKGTLLSVNEESIRLDTSFGGPLTFRRDMVDHLDIEDRPEVIYSGPKSLDDWTLSEKEGWSYEAGKLTALRKSTISRETGSHPRIRLTFDVEWYENARFRVFLHADHEDLDEVENCFELVCQSQYVYLRKRTRQNNRPNSSTIGTTNSIQEFQEREKVRVEILQDLVSGKVRFIIDGRTVADWQDSFPDKATAGPYLHFQGSAENQIRLSRIRLTTWNGLIKGEWRNGDFDFPNLGQEEPAANEDKEPVIQGILLRNGDVIRGDALEIKDGQVHIHSPLKDFALPVQRLRSFALRSEEDAANPELRWEPIKRARDIRAYFPDGGYITFELLDLKNGQLQGRSQTFGEADFLMESFTRLDFNPYNMRR